MEIGDTFCVSVKNPIWFTFKKGEVGGRKTDNAKRELGFECDLAESLRSEIEKKVLDALEPESVDISQIDPVKDFGFVVIGKEFDSYPKKMIRDIKIWNWFLEEAGVESEDDEFEENERKKESGRRKRKKGGENEAEDWTGESEDERKLISKSRKVQKPKYSTRSKDRDKLTQSTGRMERSIQKNATGANVDEDVDEEEEDEDEDDETLGGFIVDNDELEEEGEELDEEEFDEGELDD